MNTHPLPVKGKLKRDMRVYIQGGVRSSMCWLSELDSWSVWPAVWKVTQLLTVHDKGNFPITVIK